VTTSLVRRVGRGHRVMLAMALVLLAAGVAPAQEHESFPLRDDVRQRLNSIQESWIEWLTSVQEGDAVRAARQADSLVSIAQGLGLPRLPELSVAAAARAERFAKENDFEGAELSLAAAELLDPGRAETAFARATVRGQRGERLGAMRSTVRGYWRSLFDPLIGMHAVAPCEECHLSAAFQDAKLECLACHRTDDVHQQKLGKACADCHNPNAWSLWEFDHNTHTKFQLDGGHEGIDCLACHKRPVTGEISLPSSCVACHRQDDIHDGNFGRYCNQCHNSTTFDEVEIR